MQRILFHAHKHHDAVIDCCDFIINKKELNQLLDDDFIKMTMLGKKIHEIRCMDHGYVGHFMGVKIYLFDGDK